MRICIRLILICVILALPNNKIFAQRASISVGISKDYQQRAASAKSASHYSEAEAIYKQALSDDRLLNSHKMSLVLNYVDLCFLRGDNNTAIELLQNHKPETQLQKNRWIIRQAIAYSFVPDYIKADSLFSIASNIINLDADAKYELLSYQGSMWIDRKNYTLALSYLDSAQKMTSADKNQYRFINLEKVKPMAYIGKMEDALRLIDSCIVWIKDNLGLEHHSYLVALRKKAELLMMQGNLQEAKLAFEQFFEEDKKFVKNNYSSMSEQKRLDFWKTQKPFLTQIFAMEEYCPDFLLEVSLFRREIALLGNADSLNIQKRLNISGKDLRNRLKKDEIAIDYVCYSKVDSTGKEDTYYAAIIVPSILSSKKVEFVTLGSSKYLEEYKVKGHRSLLDAIRSNGISDKNNVYNDPRLYNLIWLPVEKFLIEAKDIYFVPDGIINLLGIENIRGTEKLGAIHRLTSLARLHEKDNRNIKKNNAILIGGLNYDKVEQTDEQEINHDAYDYLIKYFSQNGIIFKYLNNARTEVNSIDSLFTNSVVSYEESEELLKDKLATNKFNIIHLSTHGYALQVNVSPVPHAYSDSLTEDKSLLASGIALSGANVAALQNNKDDGLLSAREFCDMNLKNVDLIVLSACQTALGEVSDEGPAGIIRGLKKAGANTIMATLWSVNDYSTALFMKFFYEEYAKTGQSNKHHALKMAQQRLKGFERKKYKLRFDPVLKRKVIDKSEFTIVHPFEDPYYWAPFILIETI